MVAGERELFQDCQVLFGGELNVSRNFLEYLQTSGVKKAYRRLVKETHPDKLATCGKVAQAHGARKFQLVQKSYERLSVYIQEREKGFTFTRPPIILTKAKPAPARPKPAYAKPTTKRYYKPQYTKAAPTCRARRTATAGTSRPYGSESQARTKSTIFKESHLFKGDMPNRPMLFGHFLYYSGLIDWRTIVKALVWQRAARPRIGDIGVRFGWLNNQDVVNLLGRTNTRNLFGRRAVESGMLSKGQLNIILNYQRSQQKRVGEYFVRQNIFSKEKLSCLLDSCNVHNRQCNGKRCQKAS